MKKRIPVDSRGKSGGARIILAFKKNRSIFYIYGFTKGERGNIAKHELQALKRYAMLLFNYSNGELITAVINGALIEVKEDE